VSEQGLVNQQVTTAWNINQMHIYVVDDDAAIHAVLRVMLPGEATQTSFVDPRDFLDQLDALPCGVVLLDVCMPGVDGHSVHREIIERGCDMAVIFLTGEAAAPAAVEALHRGAADYVCKPFRRATLSQAIDRAVGKLEELARRRATNAGAAQLARLSPREMQVLKAIARGKGSKVIAHDLSISARTVEMHRARICEKLRTNTVGALLLAAQAGALRSEAA